jgi:hypothetical protein
LSIAIDNISAYHVLFKRTIKWHCTEIIYMTSSHSNPQFSPSFIMARPHNGKPNPEKLADNGVQGLSNDLNGKNSFKRAYLKFTQAVEELINSGIKVHLFKDGSQHTLCRRRAILWVMVWR